MNVERISSVLSALRRVRTWQVKQDRGATATEYALLVGFIAIVITVGVVAFGNSLNDFYDAIATTISGVL